MLYIIVCSVAVPSSCIFNYDKTNLQDNQTRSWVFVRCSKKGLETSTIIAKLQFPLGDAEILHKNFFSDGIEGGCKNCTNHG